MSTTMHLLICMAFTLLIKLSSGQNNPWLLETNVMPDDSRLIPAVGNGHVATQVYSNTTYINNVYNGFNTTSHRARIPSSSAIEPIVVNPISTNFVLRMRDGMFNARYETAEYSLNQYIYAHRTRTRILVNEFTVERVTGTGDIVIDLNLNMGGPTDDLNLSTVDHDVNTSYTSGPIVEPETLTSDIPVIHQYWTKVPPTVTLLASETERSWRYLTSISIDQSDALSQFQSANNVADFQLRGEHTNAWNNLWLNGDISVESVDDDEDLTQTLHAALFHILISTPDIHDNINPFAGLSPGGLARGGQINNNTSAYNDYLGHVFWDMDTWIMPPILMIHPEMAKLMIGSRYRVLNAARDHAIASGYAGARYVWEQAYTGYETCPWDLASLYQIHVTADVSYSIRQYLYNTEDVAFVNNDGGKILALEIARFWESRSSLVDPDKGYEIFGVMGPDENSANVNNSVFTNYQAKLSLTLPQYLADKLGISFTPAELAEMVQFQTVADNMYLPFDEELQYHPQYDGFDYINATIKQSDVVLLGYPLMKNMTETVRRNDLELYEQLTDKFGPDTGTWSMHTVGWLELGNATKAQEMFEYMFRNINGPFKIFSEKPEFGPDGMRATNFITLAGGLLQAVFFGYGGIRVKATHMEMNPIILPNSTEWSITSFNYRGSNLDFTFDEIEVSVTVTNQDAGIESLVLLTSSGRFPLSFGAPVVVSRGPMTIVTESDEPFYLL